MTSRKISRHFRAQWLLVTLLRCSALGPVLLPSGAFAQQEDDKVQAKQAFQQGVAQYEAGHYAEALERFQEAYRLKPHPLVRVNIANCYDRLDKPVEAIFHFELFMESKEGSPAQRNEVKSALKELHKRAGKLALTVSPDGARVSVDDGDEHKAPITEAILLKAGKHKVIAKLDGYETTTKDVDVKGDGITELSLRLSRSSAVAAAIATDTAIPTLSMAGEGEGASEPEPAAEEATEKAEPEKEEHTEAPAAAAEPTPAEPEPASDNRIATGWIIGTGAATGAFLITCIVTGVLAERALHDFNANLAARFDDRLTVPQQGIAWSNANTAADRAHKLAITSDVSLGLTIVGAITTVTLLIINANHKKPAESTAMLVPTMHPHGAGLAFTTAF